MACGLSVPTDGSESQVLSPAFEDRWLQGFKVIPTGQCLALSNGMCLHNAMWLLLAVFVNAQRDKNHSMKHSLLSLSKPDPSWMVDAHTLDRCKTRSRSMGGSTALLLTVPRSP